MVEAASQIEDELDDTRLNLMFMQVMLALLSLPNQDDFATGRKMIEKEVLRRDLNAEEIE